MSGGNEDDEPQSVNTAADKAKFITYLQGVLNHLREHEKAVMESVFVNIAMFSILTMIASLPAPTW